VQLIDQEGLIKIFFSY